MPTYKLEYFDLRGRGELARYIFHAAGMDFEDVRYKPEQWPAVKPSTPFGQLPVLHVDGKKLAQSGAIARFLAREFDLAGKNNWENGLVDQYMELAKELVKSLNEVVYPKYCGLFEKALKENGGKYLVGTAKHIPLPQENEVAKRELLSLCCLLQLTLADLAVLDVFDSDVQINKNMMDSFPKLKAHRQCIESLPALAGYIKNRKVADV